MRSPRLTKSIALKATVSCFFIIYLARSLDIPTLLASWERISLKAYSLSLGLMAASLFLTALKYTFLLRDTEARASLGRLFSINLISTYYGLMTPSLLGANVAWWYKVTRNRDERSYVFALVMLENLLLLLIACLGALVTLSLSQGGEGVAHLRAAVSLPVIMLSLLTLGAIIYGISRSVRDAVHTRLGGLLTRAGTVYGWLAGIPDAVGDRDRRSAVMKWLVVPGVLGHLLYVVRILFLAWGSGVSLSVCDATWIGSLILVMRSIPVSLAGIGVSEWGYAQFFVLLGLSSEDGVLVSLLMLSQLLVCGLVGWVLDLVGRE